MGFADIIEEKAKAKCPTIVFAEGDDPVIVEAACECARRGIAKGILVSTDGTVGEAERLPQGVSVIELADQDAKKQAYAELYEKMEDFPAEAVRPMMDNPVNFAAMMLTAGDADGMIAGHIYTTADVISSANMFVGVKEGVATASSYVYEDIPGWDGGEGGLIAFGDCSMVAQPNAEELASIAINTADSVHALMGWEPRVAMISFSTTGSASHPDVDKVREALAIAREKRPDLVIDGEMQVDSAVKPSTSLKKVKGANPLKGQANVLIFPDLDAGNAACKLVQIFAKANMYGAVMCGFKKPLSDLSRNMGVEDVVGVTAIVAAQA